MGRTKPVEIKMKIGIIGLGSIGQRHVRCLKDLGYIDIVALRTKKGTLKRLPDDLSHIQEIYDEKDFFSMDIEGIIISNPTSLHIKSMEKPLEKEIPIFVEKPIASSLDEIKKIKNYDLSKVTVGFCFRYNEIIEKVKEVIDEDKIGNIFKAKLYCGQYLPLWHPYADYKNEYYSKKSLGGGVLKTLSHELDLLFYFFKDIKEIFADVRKISDLGIDVSDNAYILCKTRKDILASVELDYLNPENERKGVFFGSKGMLTYSFLNKKIIFIDNKGKKKILYENQKLDYNDMYIKQMRGFINLIKGKKENRCNYNDGLRIMKLIDTAERSSKKRCWQKLG